jgi:hypothetical protein
MPRDEVGIEEPLKRALLERGAAFEALIDAAKDWEKQTAQSRQEPPAAILSARADGMAQNRPAPLQALGQSR